MIIFQLTLVNKMNIIQSTPAETRLSFGRQNDYFSADTRRQDDYFSADTRRQNDYFSADTRRQDDYFSAETLANKMNILRPTK